MKRILNKETIINRKHMNNQKGIALVPLIIIIVVVVAIAGGVWYGLQATKTPANNANKITNQVAANTNTTNQNANANAANVNVASNANTNTATDETLGWKTYKNQEFGYSIKYPNDYQASGTAQSTVVSFAPPENTFLPIPTVRVSSKGINDYEVDLKTQYKNSDSSESILISEDKITITGQSGKKLVFETDIGLPATHYIVEYKGKTFDLSVLQAKNYDLFEKMVSTFQFTVDTTGWKTYTTNVYGFSFMYPPDWILAAPGENDSFPNPAPIISMGLKKEGVQGTVFFVRFFDGTIDEAIKSDPSSYGTKTGIPVVIGDTQGEKLDGAFYGTQYVSRAGKTYYFEQTNRSEEEDKLLYDLIIKSFKFIK